jgi:molybdopterin-guanine dinucleotide biosynthesis protein B
MGEARVRRDDIQTIPDPVHAQCIRFTYFFHSILSTAQSAGQRPASLRSVLPLAGLLYALTEPFGCRDKKMTAIVSFIGWHDSGKTTLAAGVVAHLKRKGLRVAVIKSSDKSGISLDAPDTDTFVHRQAGADEVMLVAPDQMALLATPKKLSLTTLAHRYFPDADIVIGEGFKEARQIAKIEVVTNPEQQLRREVSGVIAVATDLDISADYVFRLNEAAEIAEFIQKRFVDNEKRRPDKTALLVNGRKIVLKGFIQDSLAGVVAGYVESLKINEELGEIELRIKL